jgi:hypothetical protein
MPEGNSEKSANEIKAEIDSWASPMEKILKSLQTMVELADDVNSAFVGGKIRLQEMDMAVANSAAGILRLGGEVSDVSNTIIEIAAGSRRNVIATEEQISKLYASSKLLDISADRLVESFGQVGYETSQIGPNIENSIGYIQSVGLNAKTVMQDVANNMSQMNRYQFEGGVAGLSKMAAQASMLRFDMRETFNFADRMLTPENAINMAASFQRLGVTAGNLVDPFVLMNESINDPTGLQNSLAKLGEEFTYFDEATKSFKINPQGVLTLKELAAESGISYEQLSKSALAAADLDERLSAISPSLTFAKEEDKQFLANMATMKDGEYVVQLKNDETGNLEQKRLGDITQEELTKLREQQENAPKTVEDIQRSQLADMDIIKADVRSIAAKGTYGVASSKYLEGNVRGAGRIATSITGAVNSEIPESKKIAETLDKSIDKIRDLYISKDSGKIDNATFTKKLESIENDIKDTATGLGSKGIDALKDIFENSLKKVTGTSGIEKEYKEMAKEIVDSLNGVNPKVSTANGNIQKAEPEPMSRETYFGYQNAKESSSLSSSSKSINSQIDFGGTITVKVEAPAGVSEQQFKTYFESEEFKKMIYKYYEDKAKELQK